MWLWDCYYCATKRKHSKYQKLVLLLLSSWCLLSLKACTLNPRWSHWEHPLKNLSTEFYRTKRRQDGLSVKLTQVIWVQFPLLQISCMILNKSLQVEFSKMPKKFGHQFPLKLRKILILNTSVPQFPIYKMKMVFPPIIYGQQIGWWSTQILWCEEHLKEPAQIKYNIFISNLVKTLWNTLHFRLPQIRDILNAFLQCCRRLNCSFYNRLWQAIRQIAKVVPKV